VFLASRSQPSLLRRGIEAPANAGVDERFQAKDEVIRKKRIEGMRIAAPDGLASGTVNLRREEAK